MQSCCLRSACMLSSAPEHCLSGSRYRTSSGCGAAMPPPKELLLTRCALGTLTLLHFESGTAHASSGDAPQPDPPPPAKHDRPG